MPLLLSIALVLSSWKPTLEDGIFIAIRAGRCAAKIP
jgi:hypothetical protein